MAYLLFAGQSNMGGITKDAAPPTGWTPDPLTFIFHEASNAWVQMQPGVNTSFSTYVGYWGPEVRFATEFRAKFPNEPLYIVKQVQGGTALASGDLLDWSPASRGELFDETEALLDRAGVALGGARPDALFFGQGEADGELPQWAQAYGANLTGFFGAARQEWLQDATGKIGFFQIGPSPNYSADVRAGQAQVDAADPNATSFSTLGYQVWDSLHYTAEGLQAVGSNFFALYSGWRAAGLESTSPVAGGVLIPRNGGSLNASGLAETFVFNPEPWSPVTIHGFAVGQDHIDLRALLAGVGYSGSDPVADGYIQLASNGAGGVRVGFDHDGPGAGMTWFNPIAELTGVQVQGLTWSALAPVGSPGQGTAGADWLTAGPSGSRLLAGDGADTLQGGAGEDFLRGEAGNDVLFGGDAFDDVHGNMGDDIERGGRGDDWVVGGQGSDILFGEEDNDIVYGNMANDTCDGGMGADVVRGGQGDDVVLGADGDDWISGDRGDDTVSGGAGADTFHAFVGAGLDRITDFDAAAGDRIQLLAGTPYVVAQVDADTVITLGTEADRIVLAGVQASSLTGGWIFSA